MVSLAFLQVEEWSAAFDLPHSPILLFLLDLFGNFLNSGNDRFVPEKSTVFLGGW